jgi:hypothetical protein
VNERPAQADPEFTTVSLATILLHTVVKVASTWRIFRKADKPYVHSGQPAHRP